MIPQYHIVFHIQKDIIQIFNILEHISHSSKYDTYLQNTRAYSIRRKIKHVIPKYQSKFHMHKHITQYCAILKRVPHAKQYIESFHQYQNTLHANINITKNCTTPERIPLERGKIKQKFTEHPSPFHTKKHITRNTTIPERVRHTEKYNIKSHNNKACSTQRKYNNKLRRKI